MNKRFYFLFFTLFYLQFSFGQVGINTNSPKTTLEVSKSPGTPLKAEGIIAPNLTRSEVISRDLNYGQDQKGALIYVTSVGNEATSPMTRNIISSGYYYFDGQIWQSFANKNVMYMPSFNLPLTAIANNVEFDLYGEYSKQFTKTGNPTFISSNPSLSNIPGIYLANQLDYVVTYNDPSIIKVNSISNVGVLNYDILNTNPCGVDCSVIPCAIKPCKAFINIVLIAK